MKWKNIRLKLMTAAMTAAMGLQMTAQPLQASAASTQYLSEVIISYGNSDQEAKDWLTQNGYKVVNQNLNEGGEGGSDAFSWLGLASEKRSVYLGYKTTTNADEAITDMKIMNMNGGYSYEAYEKVLKELEQEKAHFLENIMAALKEYRANYKAGKVKAKIAHDNLNKFKDDDSGALMGDLLLNTLRTEDEAAWEADPTKHADMVTILMQGNSTVVSEIMQNLAFAADTADDSFVNRAIAAANSDQTKNAFDTFFEDFMKKHPDYTKDEAVTELMQLYDDDAKMFASSLIGLRNYLGNYTWSELSVNATIEERDKYFENNEFEDATTWARGAVLYSLLTNVSYGKDSLASYLVYTDNDYLTDSALLSGYDALGLPQRAALYPLIAQMSAGQRCLLEYTSLDKMLTTGLMDEDTWASTYATMQDPAFGVTDYEPCSVYAEVNRNDFKVGEIAVTNAAQGKAASLGEEVNEGLFGVGISYMTAGIFAGGIAASIAGVALAAKNWSAGVNALGNGQEAIQQVVLNRESFVSVADDIGSAAVNAIQVSPEELYTALNNLNMGVQGIADVASMVAGYNVDKAFEFFQKSTKGYMEVFLEVAGPDGAEKYSKFMPVLDKDNGTITLSNGRKYDLANGTWEQFDELNIEKQIQTYKPNPDIKNAAAAAGDQLDDLTKELQAKGWVMDDIVGNAKDNINAINDMLSDELDLWLVRKNIDSSGIESITDLTDDQFQSFVADMQKDRPDVFENYRIKGTPRELTLDRKIMAAEDAKKNTQAVADEMDDIQAGGQEAADKADDAAEAAMTSGSGSTFWKWFGVGMAIVGLAMSVYSAYAAITEMQAYYHQEMLPIPRKMVDLGYYEDGSHCYIYYDCTKCNRSAMNMANETLGDYGDLNGDVMKQWLALYTTKDTRAGSPIQAGFTVKKGTTNIPVRTVPLSFFGFDYAVNMTDTKFTYNNNLNGIYLYYKQLASKYTGTVETGNALVTTGVLSALGGAGVCGLIVALAGKRRKKEKPTGEPTAA